MRQPERAQCLSIATQRLLLRDVREDDGLEAHAYRSDPEVARSSICREEWG
jgi:hypothetical protein